jgi:hypothetical protein
MLPYYTSYITIVLGLIGAFSYIRGMIYGNTRPNIVTWIFWSIAPLVGVFINYKSGIPLPLLLSTFIAGFSPLLVVIASFIKNNAYWKITKFDIFCGIFSAVAMILWVTTKNSILSLSFAIIADLVAGIPTLRKSWTHSDTESPGPYSMGIINQIITFLIIKDFSYLNIAFPIYFVLLNGAIILGIYRKKIFR